MKCSSLRADERDPGAWLDKRFARLIAGIMYRAYADFAFEADLEISLDALFWLSEEDAELYCMALGIAHDPLVPITTGIKIGKRKT